MRIAYFVHLNMDSVSGVFKKIISQVQAWNLFGFDTKLFVLTRNSRVLEDIKNLKSIRYSVETYSSKVIDRLLKIETLVKKVIAWNPDLVYLRHDLYYPPLKILLNEKPVVIEINTNDLKEYFLDSKIKWLYHYYTRHLLLKYSSGLVFVTKELSMLRQYSKFNKPSVIISNSINLQYYRPVRSPDNVHPTLFFIGHDGIRWHGIDKIIKLAKALPDWLFNIVGINKPDYEIPSNVIFYGPLKSYNNLIQNADCALGTLALHRKKINEASPLKTREYLAYGLPVIIGYTDTDFPKGADFLLQLPNTPDNIESSLDKIKEFVEKWKGKRISREHILHIDVNFKEKQRLEFFLKIIESKQKVYKRGT